MPGVALTSHQTFGESSHDPQPAKIAISYGMLPASGRCQDAGSWVAAAFRFLSAVCYLPAALMVSDPQPDFIMPYAHNFEPDSWDVGCRIRLQM
jgi:hypothetical protein